MADDTDVVFDFSNMELTREDLVTALNDMVQEYKKLSQLFEEVKAEKESCANKAELVSSSDMQAALSKLATENDELRSRSEEILNENQRLTGIISSWTRSSASLDKLHGAVKSCSDKTGLGYNSNEISTTETSCTPKLDRTKSKTTNFVKSRTEQHVEAQSGETIIADEPRIWKGRFCGMGYSAPEKSLEIWHRKRVEHMRGKPKSGGRKQGQFSRPSTKDMQYKTRHMKPKSQGQHATYQTHTR
ncbi:hypothetical protein F511_38524 [Dorcoceras hygrometricum]|uniref:Spindle pole body component 110-like n=1 Tax=Dorcoceras hygrometricum TaxID=472368 RepID=A0A2Z7BDE3_9LAMI|nr:hypothetical protein F511_38524 [Dorcoceras hygrometricum]